jgi:hypothetical protein
VVNPVTWCELVLTRRRTRGKRLRKTSPPASLVLYEGDEPGGERCAVRTAGSETGVQLCIPSVDGDKIGAVAVVQSEKAPSWVAQTQQTNAISRTGEP